MKMQGRRGRGHSRRGALQAGAGVALGVAASSLPWRGHQRTEFAASPATPTTEDLFGELDAKIEAGMARYHISGVAIGVLYQGEEYVRGCGVTNVDEPQPVDGDTLFRIASTPGARVVATESGHYIQLQQLEPGLVVVAVRGVVEAVRHPNSWPFPAAATPEFGSIWDRPPGYRLPISQPGPLPTDWGVLGTGRAPRSGREVMAWNVNTDGTESVEAAASTSA